MSTTTKKAAFKIKDYKFIEFHLKESFSEGELSVGFSPSGEYNETSGEFVLYLSFIAFKEEDENIEITDIMEKEAPLKVTLKTTFIFDSIIPYSEIPSFFYKNSIAIIFPYLRAFISTLTLQANMKPLILPLMNLTGLEQPLMENTKVIRIE